MNLKRLSLCAGLLVAATSAIAEEAAALSPAELAIQAKQQERAAQRFLSLCEHMVMSGTADEKSEWIAKLDGKTCDEAAAVISSGDQNQ